MKNLKLILPMLAFIFAIGLTFATANPESEPEPKELANDYLLINGSWEAIPEQDCSYGQFTCQVEIGEGGPVYEVYDEMDETTLKPSPSPEPRTINL